jgi:hypothetical protein
MFIFLVVEYSEALTSQSAFFSRDFPRNLQNGVPFLEFCDNKIIDWVKQMDLRLPNQAALGQISPAKGRQCIDHEPKANQLSAAFPCRQSCSRTSE